MANTDVEIRISVTNGGCNIEAGMYPIKTPLHIEITPNKLYGNTTKTPKLSYCYASTGMAAFSESFTKSDENDVWYLDTSLMYYALEDEDMFCKVSYTYEKKYAEVKNNLTKCSTDTPDGVYPFEERTITLTADENCEFHVTPKISYYDYDKSGTSWKWVYMDFEFERVSESEYKYTFTPNKDNNIYTVSAEAVTKTDITDKYGLIAVYKPTKDILVELSKVRFYKQIPESVKVGEATIVLMNTEYVDTANYAISLRKMYFSIETSVTENICLGPYNTEISCDVIGTDIITINMGTIAIAGRYQNIMDYKNTDMQIYLPFIGFVDLSPSDFMDKAITLKYEVNIINGDALAVLYADNEIMKMMNCNASFPVPYRLNDRENVNTTLEPNTNYLLSEKPFIYVKSYNEAIPDNRLPYNDTKFYAKFSDVTGYTQATEIDLTIIHDYITTTEIDEIKQLLNTGVFL